MTFILHNKELHWQTDKPCEKCEYGRLNCKYKGRKCNSNKCKHEDCPICSGSGKVLERVTIETPSMVSAFVAGFTVKNRSSLNFYNSQLALKKGLEEALRVEKKHPQPIYAPHSVSLREHDKKYREAQQTIDNHTWENNQIRER